MARFHFGVVKKLRAKTAPVSTDTYGTDEF
jgi:hypothetical protein